MPVVLSAAAAECPIQLSSLLLQPELSDVQICVFENQKKTTLFHAHKLLLGLGSDVFKTMFFGSVPQENPVVVEDTKPAAFEAFLRFVYTGATTITEADVFPLLYLGKKYMVGSLIKAVLNHLEGCITSENVGQLVLSGQDFLEDAPPKFWESVEILAEALLKSDGFLQLRKDAVQALVQRELDAEEKFIYDMVVAWAKADCSRSQLPVVGETLRSALEGIVQHVRFPIMTAGEFARGPANESVLSAEEKVEVFGWLMGAIPQTIFPDAPRCTGETYVCERLTMYATWGVDGTTHGIDFSVSQAICVTGLGAYGFHTSRAGGDYAIVVQLALGPVVLATKELTGTVGTAGQIISVSFDKPVKIDAAKRYTTSVIVTGPYTYFGRQGTPSKTISTRKGDIVFNFMRSDSSKYTTVDQGQIPQILFRV